MSTTTRPGRVARLRNCLKALKASGEADERARWPRERLLAHQQELLGELVAHATRNSTFYRARYGGILDPGDVSLGALPSVTKAEWMRSFDDVVTDPRLTLDTVESHLAEVEDDVLHLGRYRVMASSGSTGRRGVYVWSDDDWVEMLANLLRESKARGEGPSLPRRRMVLIMAPNARHVSRRFVDSLDGGIHRILTLGAAAPVPGLVAALNRFQPHKVLGYPSVVAQLAIEQRAGRLDIRPRWIATSGEILTPEMRSRIQEAWGVRPDETYAMTETGPAGTTCPEGNLHLFEDACILEPVDDEGRPVEPGIQGSRVLVTSLINRTQPVIRMEVSDELAISPESCNCGRTLVHLEALRGRSDDILHLPTAAGSTVAVHPSLLREPFAQLRDVVSYQFVRRPHELDVQIVQLGADDGLPRRLQVTLEAILRDRGVVGVPVRVQPVDHIAREAGAAKFKLVRTETESVTA